MPVCTEAVQVKGGRLIGVKTRGHLGAVSPSCRRDKASILREDTALEEGIFILRPSEAVGSADIFGGEVTTGERITAGIAFGGEAPLNTERELFAALRRKDIFDAVAERSFLTCGLAILGERDPAAL